ncbi:MAG: hypothetical protein BJ554DRAFT_6201 [Olpidium bornovanus]|uniref:Uncharacterized protein n=1 Tax=Olpidium bornovanus TaxID=278681 RepID=A0A8H7ZYB3_9FUNG|nr:MAG: hypothetical protein BJ554DRAFT_6201 [Olpidium bornovanus]
MPVFPLLAPKARFRLKLNGAKATAAAVARGRGPRLVQEVGSPGVGAFRVGSSRRERRRK